MIRKPEPKIDASGVTVAAGTRRQSTEPPVVGIPDIRSEAPAESKAGPGAAIQPIDCSAVVDALTAVEGTAELRALMAGEQLAVPTLLDVEIGSALRGVTLRHQLSVSRAQDALTDYDDPEIDRWMCGDALRRRAFQLRDAMTTYDAAYVVLAEALECPLVTRDRRLARAGGRLITVDVD